MCRLIKVQVMQQRSNQAQFITWAKLERTDAMKRPLNTLITWEMSGLKI